MINRQGVYRTVYSSFQPATQRLPDRAVPLRYVIGVHTASSSENAPCDQVAVVDVQGVNDAFYAGAQRLPTHAVPFCNAAGGHSAGCGETAACDQGAIMDGQREHAIVHTL